MAGSIFIPLISVFDNKGISQAKTGLASIAGVVKGLKTTALTAAASMASIGSINFVKDSINSARDLQSSYVGLTGLYGDLAPKMKQYTIDAQAIGLSQLEASRSVTFLGSALNATGMPIGDVADKTKNLIGIASDLAATFGLPLQEALTGIGATFRGEYDPIERFGVAIKQAQVNALLMSRGQKGLTGQALAQAQAQARYDLLLQATTKTQGNYAKQQDSLYVKQQNTAASFENLKASLGKSLLDPLAALLGALQPLISVLGKALTPAFKLLADIVTMLSPLFLPLIQVISTLFEAFMPILGLLQQLLKPLMIPLVGIVQLLAAVMKPLIPIITLVANVLSAVLTPVLSFFSIAIGIAIKGVAALIGSLASIPAVGAAFESANKSLQQFATSFDPLVDKFSATKSASSDLTDELSKPIGNGGVATGLNNVASSAKNAAKASVDAAKAIADSMKSLVADAVNIQKSIMDSANITGLLDTTSSAIVQSAVYIDGKFQTVVSGVKTGGKDLVTAFKDSFTKIATFGKNIKRLTAMGLNTELISQITSAGPEAGNATAEAIIASGKSGITSLNKTFTNIKRVSGDIGARVATAMHNTGKDIGNGLIDGLMAQSARLNAVATSMADAFATNFADTITTSLQTGKDSKGNPGAWSTAYKIKPVFQASALAGVLQGTDRYSMMNAYNIKNPFNQASNPTGFNRFQTALTKAQDYNISIQVAPTANGAQVGEALVQAIRQYERSKGAGWRQ
jgi:hypothetical protein